MREWFLGTMTSRHSTDYYSANDTKIKGSQVYFLE